MIKENTTGTTCTSCGAFVPEEALLCPGCGRPNVSSDFASTGSSLFTPPVEAAPHAEDAIATRPPVEPAVQQMTPTAPTPVAAPSQALAQVAPARFEWGPGDYPVAPPPGSEAEELVNRIREIEQQRAKFADENGVSFPGGGVRPLTVALVRRLFNSVLVVYGVALLNLLFLLTDFSVSDCIVELVLIAVATFSLFKLRDFQRRAIDYERADSQFVAQRQELIDRLRRIYEQNANAASPGEGTR